MWWRVLAVATAFGLLAVVGSEPTINISTTADRAVTIATMPCESRLQATSSGFVVDDGLVMTVAHAIYESRDFAVRDAFGRWHDASIVYLDLERDLAVLHIRELRASPMPMQVASAGTNVQMLSGAASGTVEGEVLRRVRITTEVIGDRSVESQRSGYELSVEIRGGDSGSAVIDDADNLVGLIFARSTRREASWATSVVEIESVLDLTGGPRWECDRASDAQLLLEPNQPIVN